jgi:hypothetical protein
MHVAFTLLIFAYFAIFRWHDLLTTRLGNIVAIAISLFWFLRRVNRIVFYGLTAASMPLFGLCLVFGLLHLLPVLREWQKVPSEAQGPSVNAQPACEIKTAYSLMPRSIKGCVALCKISY